MSQGNWQELKYNDAAPNAEVVKYMGQENDGVTVSAGLLRMIAAFNDDQWASDEAWDIQSINADTLSEGGVEVVGSIVRPASRPLPRTEI